MNNYHDSKVYCAGAYLRLSKEDADKDISDSIVNQRDLILDFVKDRPDIEFVGEFIDDGFSGVDFQRPAFLRLIRDIEAGKIDCVICKDLSRFGRNYIEAGRYLEQMFPDKNIRFIAINDGYDSLSRNQSDDLIIPFRNVINDAYCRDISVKIRSQLQIKRQKGEFISPFAAFGYKKSAEDKHKIEIDEYAANVVRDIFAWKLDGMSQQGIAGKLNEKGVLSPMDYKQSCGMKFKSGFQINSRSKWTAVTVGRILKNEIYIGVLAQGKKSTPNHKVRRVVDKPKSAWVRIDNNHDAIIADDVFRSVQHILKQDIRIAPQKETAYLFSGLLFCGDCEKNLVRNGVKQNGREYAYYMCVGNRTDKSCTSHRISDVKLEQAVLQIFRQHIANLINMEQMLEFVNNLPMKRDGIKQTDRLIAQKTAEIERYARLKVKLFESLDDGLIDKTEFSDMKRSYDEKMRYAQNALIKLKAEYDSLWESTGTHEWIERFKQHRDIEQLNRSVVVSLIDRIIVYEDNRVEVEFKYQHNYERALEYIQSIQIITMPELAVAGVM
ncbi:MAG TPA: recombinase [Ruminococcaceae bacterium]|nr:recombinase [Oscillospiraceae bacterium]